jgi:hypothetical protein
MEVFNKVDGNGNPYQQGIPKLVLLDNDVHENMLAGIKELTGLEFNNSNNSSYTVQPTSSHQITSLLMSGFGFKTRYIDNWNHRNTILLKRDHSVGFQVDSICFECCEHNHITTTSLKRTERLAC